MVLKNKMNIYVISVLVAGFCWGFMGFFTRNLAAIGIDSSGAIIIRCFVAAICFGGLMLGRDPSQFRIKLKDIWCFIGSGLFSLLFFTFCYFNAISMMSLSVAAILLYTAPTIVMLLSAVLFKEKITRNKTVAVICAFLGCILVSGITGDVSISGVGLMFGFGSGIGYALYTIFSRYALNRGYSSNAINFYSCLLATVGASIIWGADKPLKIMISSPKTIIWCLSLGLVSCFVPYLLYTFGLTGLENSKASVLASVEPVVATLVGVIIYHESMTIISFTGVVMVLAAVVILSLKGKES